MLPSSDEHDLSRAHVLLSAATSAIAAQYFLLPLASGTDRPLTRYRERVYAYELYHQLRSNWPKDWPFSLAGEVDKSGHPLIRGGALDRAKPDLLIHVPGDMNHNLVALEIKASATYSRQRAVEYRRGIKKLMAFRSKAGYALPRGAARSAAPIHAERIALSCVSPNSTASTPRAASPDVPTAIRPASRAFRPG